MIKKRLFTSKKQMVLILIILLICSVSIAMGVYLVITNSKIINITNKTKEKYRELEENFNNIFDNTVKGNNEYKDKINTFTYTNSKEKKYDIIINLPQFNIPSEKIRKYY